MNICIGDTIMYETKMLNYKKGEREKKFLISNDEVQKSHVPHTSSIRLTSLDMILTICPTAV